jgi:hypothetical protein
MMHMTPDDIEREAEEHYAGREASVPFNTNVLRGLFHGAAGLTDAERDPEPQSAEPVEQCDECESTGQNCWAHGGRERSWGEPAGARDADGFLRLKGTATGEMAPSREPRTWPKLTDQSDDDLPDVVQIIDGPDHAEIWRRCSPDGVLYSDGQSGMTLAELRTIGDVHEVLGDA